MTRRRGLLLALGLTLWLFAVRLGSQAFGWRLPERLQDMVTLAAGVIVESMPFVVLGVLLSIVVQVWLPRGWLMGVLPKRGWSRRLGISFMGVFFPVCECGNVPLSRSLMVQGFTVAESITFLLAAPIINPITIITTTQAFPDDPAIVVSRVLAALVIANFIGWVYSRHRKPNDLLQPDFVALCKRHQDGHNHGKVSESFSLFNREIAIIMPALFIGATLAALIQTAVPRDVLYSIGGDPVWSILAMMALAFIVSICSNVDAFFALAFRNSFTSGSLVSFLVFGPIIDIKMLNLMRTTFRPIMLVQLTVMVALLSAIAGLVVQYAF